MLMLQQKICGLGWHFLGALACFDTFITFFWRTSFMRDVAGRDLGQLSGKGCRSVGVQARLCKLVRYLRVCLCQTYINWWLGQEVPHAHAKT